LEQSDLNNSRRRFLKTGAVVSVAPFVPLAGVAGNASAMHLGAVIIEAGAGEARAFGRRLGTHGLAIRPIRGDITPVWYGHLDALWRTQPTAIAGMTRRPALFCLEQLARDHGMRVIHHAWHLDEGANAVAHVRARTAAAFRRADLDRSGAQWTRALADEFISLSTEQSGTARGFAGGSLDAAFDEHALHSWVIAPVRRNA
jgi:hypothetical protein